MNVAAGDIFEGGHMLVVGGGTMGAAICEAVLGRRLTHPTRVTVAEPESDRRAALQARLGVRAVARAAEALDEARLVLLAVKPQAFPRVAEELQGRIPQGVPVLSIMAGLTLERVAADLGHAQVVRSMPNAAARVFESATVWCAAPAVTAAQRDLVRTVLGAIGHAMEVEEESLLDSATAVSGSGPAYLCLVAEAMIEGAVGIGLTRALAQHLVFQTFVGTASLLGAPGAHPALVRESVTSPGGTTAAGLQALERGAVRAAFVEAIRAGLQRARELGSNR